MQTTLLLLTIISISFISGMDVASSGSSLFSVVDFAENYYFYYESLEYSQVNISLSTPIGQVIVFAGQGYVPSLANYDYMVASLPSNNTEVVATVPTDTRTSWYVSYHDINANIASIVELLRLIT